MYSAILIETKTGKEEQTCEFEEGANYSDSASSGALVRMTKGGCILIFSLGGSKLSAGSTQCLSRLACD